MRYKLILRYQWYSFYQYDKNYTLINIILINIWLENININIYFFF